MTDDYLFVQPPEIKLQGQGRKLKFKTTNPQIDCSTKAIQRLQRQAVIPRLSKAHKIIT